MVTLCENKKKNELSFKPRHTGTPSCEKEKALALYTYGKKEQKLFHAHCVVQLI